MQKQKSNEQDEQNRIISYSGKNLWEAGDLEGFSYESCSVKCYLKMSKTRIQTITDLASKNNIAMWYYELISLHFDLQNYSFPRLSLTSSNMFEKK